jgi:hypothetical protein
MCGMLIAFASLSSRLHDTLLTASGDQAHSSTVLVRPMWLGNQKCEPSHP